MHIYNLIVKWKLNIELNIIKYVNYLNRYQLNPAMIESFLFLIFLNGKKSQNDSFPEF